MKLFEIPTRRVPVRVQLARAHEVDGAFYVAESGPDGQPATLEQRLNDDQERFLALDSYDGGHLLRKSRIAVVQTDGAAEDEGSSREGTDLAVQVDLVGEVRVEGQLRYTMPAGRERLLDFLNAAPRFIAIHTTRGVAWFNRDLVLRVRDVNRAGAR